MLHTVKLSLFALIVGTVASVCAVSPCQSRTDVPCVHIPHCDKGQPAKISNFKVSNADRPILASQPTTVQMCHDKFGIQIHETARDNNIFTPWTGCNSPVWQRSSVMEIFVAPITSAFQDPKWYWEIDTAPSAATFASLIFNAKGTSNNCPSGKCVAGELSCRGMNDFSPHKFGVSTTVDRPGKVWTSRVTIPYTLFPELKGSGLFRMNFYRYSYPVPGGAAELSAWSPTFNPSFHVPSKFGIVVLDP